MTATVAMLVEPLAGDRGQRLRMLDGQGRPASFADVLGGWQAADGAARCRAWTAALASLPHAAVFWELPPLSSATLARPFECVAIDAPALAAVRGAPDHDSFARAFAIDDGTPYTAFDNLGGDARLLAPRPAGFGPETDGRHLLAFLRSAPPALADALWPRAAREALRQAADGAVWLSTSGLGVRWLHLRLDRRPKYYSHAPYRDPHWPAGH